MRKSVKDFYDYLCREEHDDDAFDVIDSLYRARRNDDVDTDMARALSLLYDKHYNSVESPLRTAYSKRNKILLMAEAIRDGIASDVDVFSAVDSLDDDYCVFMLDSEARIFGCESLADMIAAFFGD